MYDSLSKVHDFQIDPNISHYCFMFMENAFANLGFAMTLN